MADPSPAFILKERSALPARIASAGGAWFFSVALLLAAAAAVAAGGLYFYVRALEATRSRWLGEVAAREAELRPELLAELTALSRSFAVARELVANHAYPSNALLFVQSITHPFVSFTNFSFSRDARTIELTGAARSYQTVAEQVSFVESHPQVERVEFGGLSRSERGLVNFKLAIVFKPSLLQLRSQ